MSDCLVSSAVERQPFKLVVEGSIPSWGASFFPNFSFIYLFLLNIFLWNMTKMEYEILHQAIKPEEKKNFGDIFIIIDE